LPKNDIYLKLPARRPTD